VLQPVWKSAGRHRGKSSDYEFDGRPLQQLTDVELW
jgi:hypothetical protein